MQHAATVAAETSRQITSVHDEPSVRYAVCARLASVSGCCFGGENQSQPHAGLMSAATGTQPERAGDAGGRSLVTSTLRSCGARRCSAATASELSAAF